MTLITNKGMRYPNESTATSIRAPFLPGTNVWINSDRPAMVIPIDKEANKEIHHFFKYLNSNW